VAADTGRTGSLAVRADFTLTFGFAKAGLFLEPGRSLAGELSVVDLGLKPEEDRQEGVLEVITPQWCGRVLPQRSPAAHKGDFGHVLVIGGQRGMSGAVVMAAEAALLSGAGLVSIAAPEGLHDIIAVKVTEVMQHPLPQAVGGYAALAAAKELLRALQKATVVALGPGMGTAPETVALLKLVLPQIQVPLVVDADGLNGIALILKEEEGFFSRLKMPLVLTPHPGELSRLTGRPVGDLESRRLAWARTCAGQWGVTLVSKGASTLVAEGGGRVHLNPTGNSGMATGGSGDVLTGIISGLLAQGLDPFEAASLGVFLHGRAGDLALLEKGPYSLRAGDLLACLPGAFRSIKKPGRNPGL
jgi:NAD(P)H-hydrate epimerase